MDPQQPVSKTPYIAIAIGTLAVFVLLIGFLYMNSNKNKEGSASTQNQQTSVTQEPSPTPIQVKGSISLSAVPTVKTGNPLVVTATADSTGESITGYDLLIGYDSSAFDFTKGTTSIKDFSLFTFKQAKHVTVTAIKPPQSKSISAFSQSPLLTLTFLPKKPGIYSFTVLPQEGKEKTAFVTTQSQKLRPAGNTVTVKVE